MLKGAERRALTSLLRKRDIFNEWESLLKHLKFNPAHYCRDEAELMEQDSSKWRGGTSRSFPFWSVHNAYF